jgi:hypothetical protein
MGLFEWLFKKNNQEHIDPGWEYIGGRSYGKPDGNNRIPDWVEKRVKSMHRRK